MNINQLVTPQRTARWYTRQGEALYQVPYKDKKKPGMKEVTLREARELKLLPSVTTILQVMAKPELEAWKIEQGILAALTLPRKEGEDLGVFAKRVVQDSQQQVTEAADFGTVIHKMIEAHLTGNTEELQKLVTEETAPYLDCFIKWQGEVELDVYQSEQVVVNDVEGYAGRLDLHGRISTEDTRQDCVIDFKTQRIRDGKVKWYDEWPIQLAAYAHAGCWPIVPHLVSVVVNSEKPEPPWVRIWEDECSHWQAFQYVLALWKYLKNYDPCAL